MQRLNSNTVEFTSAAEVTAHERFNEALDEGASICGAARIALEEGLSGCSIKPRFTRAFVEYLSEGTLWVTKGGTVIATVKGRQHP